MSNKVWDKKEIENLKNQLHKQHDTIQMEGRNLNAVNNKIKEILTDSLVEESKHIKFNKEIKTRSDIIQFIKSHKNEEVYYVCVFPSMKHEDILIKLERRVKMCLKIGKIKEAKLCSNENNIVVFINDFDIRHFKRDQIVCILFKKFDITYAFKNVIVFCRKKII